MNIRNRSHSRSRLIETSFDSRTFSSTEDLDEVDRLANHPVLRSCVIPAERINNLWRPTTLRKSVSETEDILCRGGGGGLSVWNETRSVSSNRGSPTGCFLPRSRGMIFNAKGGGGGGFGISRSTTINVHLSASNASPVNSATANSWTFRSAVPTPSPEPTTAATISPTFSHGSRRSGSSAVVQASPSGSQYIVRAVIENATTPTSHRECFTPPPQPTARPESSPSQNTPPNTAPMPNKFGRVPQNLLRLQQQQQQQQSETAGSNNEVSSSSPDQFSRLRSLRARLQLEQEDSSSADSTPQRVPPTRPHHYASSAVRRGAEAKRAAPPPPIAIAPKPVLKLSSKFFSSGESSCSSAMSSLESIRSNASDGIQSLVSSESGPVSSMSSHSSDGAEQQQQQQQNLRHHRSKVQVLSPISDKSQEQCSEHGDQNRTPKVSPTEVDNRPGRRNSTSSNNNNNGDDPNVMDVPWEMPKLRRRLQQQQQQQQSKGVSSERRRTLELQGSDSGISIASQDVQEIRELLNVPWDMPKLRKKTERIFSSFVRPHSSPSAYNPSQSIEAFSEKISEQQQHNFTSEKEANVASSVDVGCIIPPPLSHPLPPPPPGFEDLRDEFYLSQSTVQMTSLRRARKQRPKMTLSFGVDPSLKTLMFATNSPFSLNDCEEVDPNLPLDRQDWYHGAITRQEAENILRPHLEGSYLVRNVDQCRQEFALSLKSAKGFMHMRIRRDPCNRDFQLSDFPRKFMTISQMIHHYTRNRLPIRGAEHMCLKRPVREQLL